MQVKTEENTVWFEWIHVTYKNLVFLDVNHCVFDPWCLMTMSSLCSGLWWPHEEALPGPEGQAFLCWTLQIHVLWTHPRHGTTNTSFFLGNISGSEVCPFYCSGRCVCSDLVDFGLEAILIVPTTVLCVFQVWEGQNIVKLARMMLGETNPADSKPGSIRGDLCIDIGRWASAHSVVFTLLKKICVNIKPVFLSETSSTAATLWKMPRLRSTCGSRQRSLSPTPPVPSPSCMSKLANQQPVN